MTVDAPVLGNRERDQRAPFEDDDEERGSPLTHLDVPKEGSEESADISVASAFSKQDDPDKTWEKVSLPSTSTSRRRFETASRADSHEM